MKHLFVALFTATSLIANSDLKDSAFSISQECSIRRPQEPQAPYPYNEEEICFKNPKDGVILAGTLTLPKGNGPFPAAILLHGSAPFDRDSSISGHKPFLVLADHLTRQGIAVLRFDKRGAGKSGGVYSEASLEDFANDARAAFAYLKERKEIGTIGLIGHSEGGNTAALASSKLGEIGFIVTMAAPCLNWEDLILEQEGTFQRADGVAGKMIAEIGQFRKMVCELLKKEDNRETAETQLRNLFNGLTPDQKKVVEAYYGKTEGQIQFFNSVGFRYCLSHDPADVLKKVNSPILALNGNLDLVVSSKRHLSRLEATLKDSGHTDYTIVEFPKLNHGFQTCQTGSFLECGKIDETIAPSVLKTISDWILEKNDNRP